MVYLERSRRALPRPSLPLTFGKVLRNTRKYNFIYAQMKNAVFLAPILTKLSFVNQNYMQVAGTECHQNWSINAECTGRGLFTSTNNMWL
jgi:hypothetical protein